MANHTLPSSNNDSSQQIPLRKLHEILAAQQENLTLLCTVMNYLKGFAEVGIDEQDLKKYNSKLHAFKVHQKFRFEELDALINSNVKEVKKGKTTNESVFKFGREIRKFEAGLRTLGLFTFDVIEMLKKDATKINRVDERIRYFENRAATLEVEMRLLSTILPNK